MDNDDLNSIPKPHSVRNQLVKLLVGTTAAFIATKVAENTFDRIIEKRQNAAAEVQQ